MQQVWKNTLYLYVDQHNRQEVDDRHHAIKAPITDMDYNLRMSERSARLKDWYKQRGAMPAKSQTKAKLVRTYEGDGEVLVDMEFHIQRTMDQQGFLMLEERIEKERITLSKEGDSWVVARVEHKEPERAVRRDIKEEEQALIKSRSKPYLNPSLLGSARTARRVNYRRDKAVEYAEQWWNEPNPRFEIFELDCTNYVSQCLFAGGAPMDYTGRRESGWWYRGKVNGKESWSYSWSVANSLEHFLLSSKAGLRAELVNHPNELKLGDVIQYDWDGDGNYQHSTIVTAFDLYGMPLVNAHTTNSRHRYWDYQDSYAWNEATNYRFFHIADIF
ncbi:amidase domain-containing protein [Paenibacillus aquistagni]|uniref:amidase domain-containing protein n=1 Tax=Paenibacillus aquistagni TaxID=1852522 RepID=UPI000B50DB27|nr:amidase domain-containing protein [Paenibacillus aquistagni]